MATRKTTYETKNSVGHAPDAPEFQVDDSSRNPREIVAALIHRVDEALQEKLTPSVADLIRLIQLQKDLGEEAGEIRITWIENS